MLSQEEINKLFTYKEGNLFWNEDRKKNGAKAGEIAGVSKWRPTLRIGDKTFRCHRLIWVMHFGSIPEGLEIDHIDLDKTNNKIENLRLVTRAQNLWNRKVFSNSKTGVKGVVVSGKKFAAKITINQKVVWLGRFDALQEAANAYKEMALKIHGEYANF